MFSSRFCERLDPFRKNFLDPFGKPFCLLLSVLSISNSNYTMVLGVKHKPKFKLCSQTQSQKNVEYLNSLRYAQRTIESDPVSRLEYTCFLPVFNSSGRYNGSVRSKHHIALEPESE